MLLDSNKNKASRKIKIKIEQFFKFRFIMQNIIHDKIIRFDAALLVQKSTIREGYAEESIKSNYSLI